MVIRYHWGHGVGHTYAFGSAVDVDTMQASLLAETEEQENNVSRQEVIRPGEVEGGLDDRLLGEDDMVYQNDSDDNVSDGGADDEVCSQHDAFVAKSTHNKLYSKHTSIQRYVVGRSCNMFVVTPGEALPPPLTTHSLHLLCILALHFSLRPLSPAASPNPDLTLISGLELIYRHSMPQTTNLN
jgi:hypothetical protein